MQSSCLSCINYELARSTSTNSVPGLMRTFTKFRQPLQDVSGYSLGSVTMVTHHLDCSCEDPTKFPSFLTWLQTRNSSLPLTKAGKGICSYSLFSFEWSLKDLENLKIISQNAQGSNEKVKIDNVFESIICSKEHFLSYLILYLTEVRIVIRSSK